MDKKKINNNKKNYKESTEAPLRRQKLGNSSDF
jgi:hypothetical protein